ncbi:amino acid adenylation domain-containing protein [Providencia alcalifaciens]|nr:amino acid adenylation domain-containing protein [Providencia alcalifaciens]
MYNPVVYTKLQAVKDSDNLKFIELFLQQVECNPNHPAVITSEKTITYADLAAQAQSLATHLLHLGVSNEMPVAIFLKSGIEQVICQVAILLAGGTCVPLHPLLPDERLNFMLKEVQAKFTITDANSAKRALSTHFIPFNRHSLTNSGYVELPMRNNGLNQRSHILFTSGTTGQPKGVEIEARGIIRMLVNSNFIHITPNDRVACHANPAFDGSFLEVWAALLNGATLVILTKETLLDPTLLEDTLQQYAISYLFMTTSLFNFIAPQCPNAFRSLNYLLIGGEAFNLQALKALPLAAWPKNMLNCYGPTEGTTITLCHRIMENDLYNDALPIGVPIDKTEVYILDEQLNPVPSGEQGEIYIGGEGIARGYINRPELTQDKFLTVEIAGQNHTQRLYRSGDIGRQVSDGSIMYIGRIDTQIKLHGYRIEVEDIEAQLLKSDQLQAAVVCIIKDGTPDAYLTAFIVPKDPSSFEINSLLNNLKQQLPPYMLPRFQVIDAIPINENGKANRPLLQAQVEKLKVQTKHSSDLPQNATELLIIWQQVLDADQPSLDDEFFLLGGTSLQAARLVLEIKRQFGFRLSIQNLYDAQTPRNLLRLLEQPQETVTEDICATLLKDSQLSEDIQPHPQKPQPWLTASAGRALLTGATGFMGAFCLRELLQLDDVRQIFCLVRAKDHDAALQRIKDNMTRYGLWQQEYGPRIVALAGDIA